ncbi:hypothetical protein A7J15_01920 [Microbacterium sediminis]|uniref:Uncharacterized protein n=1 Tax=Microbacterium sediminis TaxID=904291 RepID=A0A1B9NGV1_9MICO|nr:hypothetical protein A7J15_01920 [Microbacterium sediminis]
MISTTTLASLPGGNPTERGAGHSTRHRAAPRVPCMPVDACTRSTVPSARHTAPDSATGGPCTTRPTRSRSADAPPT